MQWSQKFGLGAVAALLLCTMSPVFAGVQHDRVVSTNPSDSVPMVLDGAGVFGIATVGGTTVAGGSFTQVRQRNGTTLNRTNIFAFDSAGAVSTTFQPNIALRVWDIIPAGDGVSVYIGGQFNNVNGAGGTSRVARVNVNTGQVMSTFRSPGFDNIVTDLELANGRLYVGGYFKNAGGQPHVGLVALNPTTGALTDHLDPITFTDVYRDSPNAMIPTGNRGVGVEKFSMTPDGSRLVAIGNFRTVSGQSRVQVAMINTSGAQAALTDWSTTRFSPACHQNFPTYTLAIDFSPDGQYFVIGTGGAFFGGAATGVLCDTNTRWETNRSGPNQEPTWVNYLAGDTTNAIHATGSAVYIGGHFRWVNSAFVGDRRGPGSVDRKGMAALDPRNGLPLNWIAGKLPLRWGVMRFVSTAEGLWVAHDGDTLGNETTGRMGLLPRASGRLLPADNTGSLPGNAYLGGAQGNDNLFRTSLTGTSATSTTQVNNGGVDWSSARGAFMTDGRLYTGWADGTLTRRSFNGTTLGAPTTVDLHDLTAFSADLANIRGMWFDRVTGRMYYTIGGQNQLYYRYFTPDSSTVGGVRFTVPNTGTGIDWGRVTGGFLANGRLYYGSNIDGALRSVQWQDNGPSGGLPTGASTVISGPAVDGRNWGSGTLFLQAP
ncbi:hypothetical protein [Nocardioides sp. GXQ0305]|uniref:hypothetical protein n=1 Tax=Nocardioides sp. GXQ0305 TaxID=3423912 RepID=UPI003D7CF27C